MYVQQQPQMVVVQQQAMFSEQWTSGLFGCFSDCGSCLLSFCLPCVQYGYNVEATYNGTKGCCGACCCWTVVQVMFGLGCLVSMGNRTEIRQKYNLSEKPCGDCLVHCFCEPCALAQEARELKARPPKPWPVTYQAVQAVQTVAPTIVMAAPQQGYPQQAPPQQYPGAAKF